MEPCYILRALRTWIIRIIIKLAAIYIAGLISLVTSDNQGTPLNLIYPAHPIFKNKATYPFFDILLFPGQHLSANHSF